MNFKIFLTLLLFGIVISVSAVSAAAITDDSVDTNDDVLGSINLEDRYNHYLDENDDNVPICVINGDYRPPFQKDPDVKA